MSEQRDLFVARHDYRNPALEIRLRACQAAMQRFHEAGVRSGYLDMATGTRKTEMAAKDVARCLEEDPEAPVLYVCHRENILEEASETFKRVLGPAVSQGFIIGGQMDHDRQITFATFAQLNRIVDGRPLYMHKPPGYYRYLIDDEAHHAPATTYRQVIDYYQPAYMKLGLTATPERRDQQEIEEILGPYIYRLPLEAAIAEGCLARPDYRVLTDHVCRLKEIETDLGSISLARLNDTIFVPRRDGEIADMIYQHICEVENPRSIVFCPTTAYADHMVDYLPGNVATLHSKLSKELQRERLAMFKTGELDMLVTVNMLNEGIHVPEANVAIMLRDTQSRTIWLQQIGRFLGDKERVLILDFVASWQRIKDIQRLQRGTTHAYKTQNPTARPEEVQSRFNFEFAEEALEAIEVVEYARNRAKLPRPVSPNKGKRLEKWQTDEAELKAMLGINELPNQSMTDNRCQRFGERIAAGDEAAKEELTMRCLRFIYGTAKTFANNLGSSELTVEDYFQYAYEGFQDALEKYDPKKHPSLRSHVQLNVYRQLVRESKKRSLILEGSQLEQIDKLDKAKQAVERKLGVAATEEAFRIALTEETGLGEDEMRQIENWRRNASYGQLLDAKRELINAVDRTAPSVVEVVEEGMDATYLAEAMDSLSYRERRVLELHRGLNGEAERTLEGTGRVFNITRERVRQIENQAIKKLENMAETQKLRENNDIPWYDSLLWRKKEEEWAHNQQAERDKKEIEKFLLSKYEGDEQSASKEDKLCEGLGRVILETLARLEEQDRQSIYHTGLLSAQLNLPRWMVGLIEPADFSSSLKWLIVRGFVSYVESADGHPNRSYVQLIQI